MATSHSCSCGVAWPQAAQAFRYLPLGHLGASCGCGESQRHAAPGCTHLFAQCSCAGTGRSGDPWRSATDRRLLGSALSIVLKNSLMHVRWECPLSDSVSRKRLFRVLVAYQQRARCFRSPSRIHGHAGPDGGRTQATKDVCKKPSQIQHMQGATLPGSRLSSLAKQAAQLNQMEPLCLSLLGLARLKGSLGSLV